LNFYTSKGFKNLFYRTFNQHEFDHCENDTSNPMNAYFGGKFDFDIEYDSEGGRDFIVHDVKSKDISKYNDFKEDLNEVIKGQLYCTLRNKKNLMMVYVFVDEEVENHLRAWLDKTITVSSGAEVKVNDPKNFNARQFMT